MTRLRSVVAGFLNLNHKLHHLQHLMKWIYLIKNLKYRDSFEEKFGVKLVYGDVHESFEYALQK